MSDCADLLENLLANVLSGDAISAARAAVMLHGTPPRGSNSRFSVDQLLSLALGSENPEFLVALGDELVDGGLLPQCQAHALRCYQRADMLSPFMGAYALGRASFIVNPNLSEKYFEKSANYGHFASAALLAKLREPRGFIRRIPWKVYMTFSGLAHFLRAYFGSKAREQFWRYKDIAPKGIGLIDGKIGEDRTDFFSAVRPRLSANPRGQTELTLYIDATH